MKITSWHPAGPGEWFAPGALDDGIGKWVPLTLGNMIFQGCLLSAEVDEDGLGVTLEMEVAD